MFDPSTPREKREQMLSQLITTAQETIARAQAVGDTDSVARLRGSYQRAATYLILYAEKQEAEAAFVAARMAFLNHSQSSVSAHVTDVANARMLNEQGVVMLSPDLFDAMRNPADLRSGAAAFTALVEACG